MIIGTACRSVPNGGCGAYRPFSHDQRRGAGDKLILDGQARVIFPRLVAQTVINASRSAVNRSIVQTPGHGIAH
jgi:hypothetical protein